MKNHNKLVGLLPLRLIADVSDGLDDGLVGDVAFEGGGTKMINSMLRQSQVLMIIEKNRHSSESLNGGFFNINHKTYLCTITKRCVLPLLVLMK